MKVIDRLDIFRITREEVFNILDIRIKEVSVNCPRCHSDIRFPESYITDEQKETIEMYCDMWNKSLDQIGEAIIKLYGADVRIVLLGKELAKIRDRLTRPQLRLVKGANDEQG